MPWHVECGNKWRGDGLKVWMCTGVIQADGVETIGCADDFAHEFR